MQLPTARGSEALPTLGCLPIYQPHKSKRAQTASQHPPESRNSHIPAHQATSGVPPDTQSFQCCCLPASPISPWVWSEPCLSAVTECLSGEAEALCSLLSTLQSPLDIVQLCRRPNRYLAHMTALYLCNRTRTHPHACQEQGGVRENEQLSCITLSLDWKNSL